MSMIHLDSRLQAALLLTQPCGVCADIGADHGRLSAALLQSGRAKQVLVADVSAPSLNKAKILLGGCQTGPPSPSQTDCGRWTR